MNQANVSGQLVLLRIRNRNPDSSVVVSRMLKRVGLGLRLCLMLVNVQALQVRYSLINVAIKGTVARTFKNLDLNQCGKMAMRGDAVAYSLYRSHLLSHWIGSCEIFTKIGGFEVKRDRNAAFYLANVQTNLKENCQGGANVNSILQSDEPCNMKANICEQLTNLKVTCTTDPENCAPSNALWCPKTEAPANSTTGTTETKTTAETTIEKTTTSTTTLTPCEAKILSTKCPADLKFDCLFDTCLGILKVEAGFDYNSINALYKPCTDRGALPVKIQNVEQNERIVKRMKEIGDLPEASYAAVIGLFHSGDKINEKTKLPKEEYRWQDGTSATYSNWHSHDAWGRIGVIFHHGTKEGWQGKWGAVYSQHVPEMHYGIVCTRKGL